MSITGLALGSAVLGGGALALGYGVFAPRPVAPVSPAAPARPLALPVAASGGALLLALLLGALPALAFLFGAATAALCARIVRTAATGPARGLGTAGAALLTPAATLLFLTGPADLAPTDPTILTALAALALGAALPASLARATVPEPHRRADDAGSSHALPLFETAIAATGAAMALLALLVKGVNAAELTRLMLLPSGIGLAGLLATVGGLAAIRTAPGRPARRPLVRAGLVALPLAAFATGAMVRLTLGPLGLVFGADLDGEGGYSGWALYGAALAGLAAAVPILFVAAAQATRPVGRPGTPNPSLHAVAIPVLCAVLLLVHRLAGPVGLAFAATALLAPLGLIAAAGEGRPEQASGAAFTATASALCGWLLFAVYEAELDYYNSALGLVEPPDFALASPYVLSGLLIGALLPRLIGDLAAAPATLAGADDAPEGKPPAPLFRLLPGLLPLLAPLFVYGAAAACGGVTNGFAALGALLVGTPLSGLFAALTAPRPAPAIDAAMRGVPLVALLLVATLAYSG